MDSTGEILRRARNERHLTLEEVATRTRINRKYLAAIESGDPASVPGGFFYKSFVRQYAAALSTDDDNVLERVEQSLAAEHPVAPPPPDEQVLKALATKAEENAAGTSSGSRSAAAYALLLVLAVAGTTGVYTLWHRAQQAQAAEEVGRSTPETPKKEEIPPPVSQQPSQPQPQAQPQAQEPVPPPVVQREPNAPPPSQGAPTTPTQAPAQPPVPVPAPDSAVPANIAINVLAKDETWVSVSADGKTLFSGTLVAGQTRTFAARENVRMRIGNAGGVDVVFNGNSIGPFGSSRQPVTLLFSPSSFEIVQPKPPDQPPPQQPN